jgi:adenylate kinase family enzyme
MKKILVIGPGGAGKSTLAARLGKLLKIEVLHLDRFYWRRGWEETPKPEWRERVQELLKREAWVMDGNFSGTLDLRLEACDTVVFLDMPRTLCLWRVFKRTIMYRKESRPDMAEGCPEKLDLKFMLWIWNYPSQSKPKVLKRIEAAGRAKNVVWLRSTDEVERFLSAAVRPEDESNRSPQQNLYQMKRDG